MTLSGGKNTPKPGYIMPPGGGGEKNKKGTPPPPRKTKLPPPPRGAVPGRDKKNMSL